MTTTSSMESSVCRRRPHATTPALADRLREVLSSVSRVLLNEPLARRTTLRVGGTADLLVEPADERDLSLVLHEAGRVAAPWMVLGRGSNLLVRDGGIRGVVIYLNQAGFSRIEVRPPRLHAGAGVRLKNLSNEA